MLITSQVVTLCFFPTLWSFLNIMNFFRKRPQSTGHIAQADILTRNSCQHIQNLHILDIHHISDNSIWVGSCDRGWVDTHTQTNKHTHTYSYICIFLYCTYTPIYLKFITNKFCHNNVDLSLICIKGLRRRISLSPKISVIFVRKGQRKLVASL